MCEQVLKKGRVIHKIVDIFVEMWIKQVFTVLHFISLVDKLKN